MENLHQGIHTRSTDADKMEMLFPLQYVNVRVGHFGHGCIQTFLWKICMKLPFLLYCALPIK